MRLFKTLPLALVAALLTACGGGGNSTLTTAALRGTVTEVDGNALDRSGVIVTLVETGERSTTGTDGSFRFNRIPTGTVRLAFGSSSPTLADLDSDDNEDDEGNRIIRNVRGGTDVRIEVTLQDGKVSRFFRVDSGRSQASASSGSDGGIEVEVEIEADDDGDEFEAEIEGLTPGTMVDILIDDPNDDLEPELLAMVTVDEDGEAEYEIETEDGDELPLGKANIEDLAGLIVIFEDTESGDEIARVTIPDLSDFDYDDDDDDDDEDDDDDDDDDDEEDDDDDEEEDDD